MAIEMQVSYHQAQQFFQEVQLPESAQVTLTFDDEYKHVVEQLKQRHTQHMIESMRGCIQQDWLSEILQDRQADKALESHVERQ